MPVLHLPQQAVRTGWPYVFVSLVRSRCRTTVLVWCRITMCTTVVCVHACSKRRQLGAPCVVSTQKQVTGGAVVCCAAHVAVRKLQQTATPEAWPCTCTHVCNAGKAPWPKVEARGVEPAFLLVHSGCHCAYSVCVRMRPLRSPCLANAVCWCRCGTSVCVGTYLCHARSYVVHGHMRLNAWMHSSCICIHV